MYPIGVCIAAGTEFRSSSEIGTMNKPGHKHQLRICVTQANVVDSGAADREPSPLAVRILFNSTWQALYNNIYKTNMGGLPAF